eukprot:TRINITY_DN8496_c0_g1_i2.p2 TRINITY_DN8496_c0_g1~~TRINITY_DN8496_c0_g1_i2.p2  ORF type:complete len:201 (+),score=30.10 TRINITY_DN8496_c0_g1_i2:83-685(+)
MTWPALVLAILPTASGVLNDTKPAGASSARTQGFAGQPLVQRNTTARNGTNQAATQTPVNVAEKRYDLQTLPNYVQARQQTTPLMPPWAWTLLVACSSLVAVVAVIALCMMPADEKKKRTVRIVEPEAAPRREANFYCKFCGASNTEGSTFCIKCGRHIEDGRMVEPIETTSRLMNVAQATLAAAPSVQTAVGPGSFRLA